MKNDLNWYSKCKFICDELAEKLQSINPNKQTIARKLFRELAASHNLPDNAPTTDPANDDDPIDNPIDDPEDIEDLDFEDDDEDEQEHNELLAKTGDTATPSSSPSQTATVQNETKEFTSKTTQSLVAVVTTLVKSADTKHNNEPSHVKKLVYSSSPVAHHELVAAADVINLLQPYVPKSTKDQNPDCNMFTLASLAFITSTVLCAVGLPKQAWKMSHKAEGLIALPLSARALYELFSNDYTIYHHDGSVITSIAKAGKRQKEMIVGFFNIQKIDKICKTQHLEP